jgi:hydroxymethylbilane synthase
VLATRGSPLARWQAERVAARLAAVPGAPPVELLVVATSGDRQPDASLAAIGGQGVFVKEVQQAVLDGRADVAVHSAKDLPAETPPSLVLAAAPERADPRDVLVGGGLHTLPTGATVATSSPRRRAQLAFWRPDLTFVEVRGNIARRLERRGGADAVVVAAAALARLDLTPGDAHVLPTTAVLPQVGQGVLACECRADDDRVRSLLEAIDDVEVHRALRAERAFLGAVGGGCRAAVGALAQAAGPSSSDEVVLDVLVAGGDGHVVVRAQVRGADPAALGPVALTAVVDRGGDVVLAGLGVGTAAVGPGVGTAAGGPGVGVVP